MQNKLFHLCFTMNVVALATEMQLLANYHKRSNAMPNSDQWDLLSCRTRTCLNVYHTWTFHDYVGDKIAQERTIREQNI